MCSLQTRQFEAGKNKEFARLSPAEEKQWARRLQQARVSFAEDLARLPSAARKAGVGASPSLRGENEVMGFQEMTWQLAVFRGWAEQRADAAALDLVHRLTQQLRQAERAREVLVVRNLPLVPFVVRKIPGSQQFFQDLVQEGNLGLITAVERFDPARGSRLSTYASWWIRQAVTKALSDKFREIRLPAHMHSRLRQIVRTMHQLRQEQGRVPTGQELSDASGLTLREVQELLLLSRKPDPLEAFGSENEEAGILDLHADTSLQDPLEATLRRETHRQVPTVLRFLSRRDQEILCLRFGIGGRPPLTLREIGKRLHLSRERIRQIEADALETIRKKEGRERQRPKKLRSRRSLGPAVNDPLAGGWDMLSFSSGRAT